ncbi:hypothetical protein [Thalassobacillus sp. C254]|uniref:hypothetical protein n=1 Tax=Thalassobacillus sp. C254 TaxID=1225341 RepID=UPI0006CF81DB|nr:hypothetical protein [Thalassobacillus sp. C254]
MEMNVHDITEQMQQDIAILAKEKAILYAQLKATQRERDELAKMVEEQTNPKGEQKETRKEKSSSKDEKPKAK